jgi:hypothetical protein
MINQIEQKFMEDQFLVLGIENYTRISAYDGRDGMILVIF